MIFAGHFPGRLCCCACSAESSVWQPAGALLHFGAALRVLPEGRVFAGLLILSTLSGAAAGLLPAVRAAALNPIDAICK